MRRLTFLFFLQAIPACTLLCAQGQKAAQLPDAPGRDTVKKVCGACHPAEVVLAKGMTREQWGTMVSNMISRGAKGTDAEFAQIVDYLSHNLPANKPTTTAAAASGPPARRGGGGLLAQAGAADKQVVDEASAERGKQVYITQCITCHGTKARGGNMGADLVRSLVVLHDRYGSTLGPFLAKGHPMQSGAPSSSIAAAQVEELSNFLHQQVENTLRTGPYNTVLNVLTGDAKAGEAYFNGAGQCSTCHSATGDLAHIASKYEPPVLQLKTVFPQVIAFGRRTTAGSKKPVTVTVTTPSGETVNGTLVEMDDFNVSLKDGSGEYHQFTRTPDLKVEKHDPYAAHVALLDTMTDQNMHDVVRYLETLK